MIGLRLTLNMTMHNWLLRLTLVLQLANFMSDQWMSGVWVAGELVVLLWLIGGVVV